VESLYFWTSLSEGREMRTLLGPLEKGGQWLKLAPSTGPNGVVVSRPSSDDGNRPRFKMAVS
jgi:hypothetical protein